MCGITGILNLDKKSISSPILKKMTDSIIHRGPNGEGIFIDNFIGFGHRRLSIIDLSEKGHQPMITSDKRYITSYNGEVYNFKEIRLELENLGYKFYSQTDTEVILNAYVNWKEECLNYFNGMFAFAIWDTKEQKLFLARDRYGIKPVYYTKIDNIFLFSSEIKSFLEHPSFKSQVDKEALVEYMTFQNFLSEKTLYKNVSLLPPGTFLQIEMKSKKFQKTQYWDFKFHNSGKIKDEREYVEELDRLFVQAVTRQLVSDVEIGSYLSGGMDSGSITAIASKNLPHMKTFTVGFDLSSASENELNFDERKNSEYMSTIFGTEHYEVFIKAKDIQSSIKPLTWHLEEPRVGQSYPNYYATKLASKFVKVVLAGTGGDELFGGYPWRYYKALLGARFQDMKDEYYSFWQRLITNDSLKNVFNPIWDEVKHVNTKAIFDSIFKNHSNSNSSIEEQINHALYFEAKTFLHGLLVIEDKISMSHSLETRVPFLDNDLVDFAQKIPVHLKMNNLEALLSISKNEFLTNKNKFFQKTTDGKTILRKMMAKHIPSSIVKAIKKGFSAPDQTWFRNSNSEYLKSLLINKNAKIYRYLDQNSIEQRLKEHFSGKVNQRLLIWSLLNLENWMQLYL